MLLMLCSLPAAAQTMYKCTAGGTVLYGDRPCAAGETAELKVEPPPAPDREAAHSLAAQKALLSKLEQERAALASREAKAAAREHKAAAGVARRCARLRLQQRWLDEDIYKAMSEQREAARRKAQRHRQTMAIECPG